MSNKIDVIVLIIVVVEAKLQWEI